jgi:membrane associated rhomboid family serine protease
MRLKGPRQSKWFALYLGATGIIFLILGVWEFITKQWNDTTNAAIVGIIFILFGATCLLGTHIHIEIYRLKQKLKELENK